MLLHQLRRANIGSIDSKVVISMLTTKLENAASIIG